VCVNEGGLWEGLKAGVCGRCIHQTENSFFGSGGMQEGVPQSKKGRKKGRKEERNKQNLKERSWLVGWLVGWLVERNDHSFVSVGVGEEGGGERAACAWILPFLIPGSCLFLFFLVTFSLGCCLGSPSRLSLWKAAVRSQGLVPF